MVRIPLEEHDHGNQPPTHVEDHVDKSLAVANQRLVFLVAEQSKLQKDVVDNEHQHEEEKFGH